MDPILRRAPQAEVQHTQDREQLSRISTATVHYMLNCGLALEAWLSWQRRLLAAFAEDEADLYEAMRLAERLNRVERNKKRAADRNDQLRAELVSRAVEET